MAGYAISSRELSSAQLYIQEPLERPALGSPQYSPSCWANIVLIRRASSAACFTRMRYRRGRRQIPGPGRSPACAAARAHLITEPLSSPPSHSGTRAVSQPQGPPSPVPSLPLSRASSTGVGGGGSYNYKKSNYKIKVAPFPSLVSMTLGATYPQERNDLPVGRSKPFH